MPYPHPFTACTPLEHSAVERAREAAAVAAAHRALHDREATFPREGLAALAANGYLALTVPAAWGGENAGVIPVLLGNLELAKGDASLALVIAMHLSFIGRVRDARLWPVDRLERVGRAVAEARTGTGALINSLATEPEMGSPSRGGFPATRATATPTGWRVDGRKSFSSGSPVLRWGVISATADGDTTPRVLNLLIPMDAPGLRIEPSWDTLGMRATGSDTLVLDGVEVAADAELPRAELGVASGPAVPHERVWSLAIAAVYLGVAEAARDYALQFARNRKPTALGGKSIASVPHIRERAGHLDLLLYQARGLLVGTARAWDACTSDGERAAMDTALVAAKVTASNLAVQVAEECMRLVGGTSMDRRQPLEQYYRDVRGGLHHPPQDDAALELLARAALDLPL